MPLTIRPKGLISRVDNGRQGHDSQCFPELRSWQRGPSRTWRAPLILVKPRTLAQQTCAQRLAHDHDKQRQSQPRNYEHWINLCLSENHGETFPSRVKRHWLPAGARQGGTGVPLSARTPSYGQDARAMRRPRC